MGSRVHKLEDIKKFFKNLSIVMVAKASISYEIYLTGKELKHKLNRKKKIKEGRKAGRIKKKK